MPADSYIKQRPLSLTDDEGSPDLPLATWATPPLVMWRRRSNALKFPFSTTVSTISPRTMASVSTAGGRLIDLGKRPSCSLLCPGGRASAIVRCNLSRTTRLTRPIPRPQCRLREALSGTQHRGAHRSRYFRETNAVRIPSDMRGKNVHGSRSRCQIRQS